MNPPSIEPLRDQALFTCDSEPIHIPGSIQPHGVLLAVEPVEFRVVLASENSAGFLGRAASGLIGRDLAEAVGVAVREQVRRRSVSGPLESPASFLATLDRGGTSWLAQARVHRRGDRLVLELEPADEPGGSSSLFSGAIGQLVTSVGDSGSVVEFCRRIAGAARTISGYDRTMIYRFHPDDHGEVVAESVRPDLVPYLGLHYPASDIPRQARELFLRSRVRVLVDRDAATVPMVAAPTESAPLDMTHCQLRSVSPVHLEYLANMGVRASMAISIIQGERLWGLLVCHHLTPMAPSHTLRSMGNFLSELISAQVVGHETLERIRARRASARTERRLLSTLSDESDWVEALLAGPEPFDEAVASGGMAVVEAKSVRTAGEVPPEADILRIVDWVAKHRPVPLFSTDALGECDPSLAGLERAVGVLAAEIGKAFPTYVLWFRPEFRRQVTWGGDPTKALTVAEGRARLSPRSSFEAWEAEVRGRSIPWDSRDLEAASEIRAAIIELVLRASLLKKVAAETNLARILKAVEASGEPILITDERGGPILVNDAFRTLFGVGPDQLDGASTCARLTDPALTREVHEATLGTGGSWRGDVEVDRPGGPPIPVSLRVDPVLGESGQVFGFIAVHTDLTERRRAERELIEHSRRLERAHAEIEAQARLLEEARVLADLGNRAKSNFLANMSHEIRTPMNGVLGMAELLLDTPLDDRQRQYAWTIRNSGDALLLVINDILDLSKIEAGKMTLNPAPFDPRVVLKEVTDLLAPLAQKKDLRMTANVSIDFPERLVGDAARIRQILTNLAGNAVKFTREGEVVLTGDLLGRSPTEAHFRIVIRDTGIGIPAAKCESIFESFNQLDAGLDRRHGGSGLGLTISRQLAELMGGQVDFLSQEGRGSTFWLELTLPLATGPGTAPPGRPVATTRARPLRILVAEDNLTNQAVARGLLARWHHEAEMVGNGREAVEAHARRPFDLILMDVQMPVMDGMRATREIRARERAENRHTPIIAMTAHAMEGDRGRCLEAGMDDYLSKPIDSVHLQETIERWRPADEPVPASPTGPAVFRPNDFLDQLGGDPELARAVIDSARVSIPEVLASIQESLASSDPIAISGHCHNLHGGALTLTADALAAAAEELQALAEAGDLPAARLRFAGLLEESRRFRDTIDAFEVTPVG